LLFAAGRAIHSDLDLEIWDLEKPVGHLAFQSYEEPSSWGGGGWRKKSTNVSSFRENGAQEAGKPSPETIR
jgi:hypothetical protein